MGACTMDGPDQPAIQSVEEMAGRFYAELMRQVPIWRERLLADASQLEPLEGDVHLSFAQGADLVLAGLIAVAMRQPQFEAACEQTRLAFEQPLKPGRNRMIRVRLLTGLVMWVASLYCERKKSSKPSVSEDVSGLYVELAQFGFGKGVTPGLQSRVTRQVALCPSLEFARQELLRSGVNLDVKAVRRITSQCGTDLLRLRRHELERWRQGKLPAGSEFAGKRVSVQIDGGRTKIRGVLRPAEPQPKITNEDGLIIENEPGRSKAQPRRTYDAEWREPKLVTIFVHDEQGRMVKGSQALLEGTFIGPNALAELVAMHLHQLGAAQALSVTFVSDGAPWIWERIPQIVELAGLTQVPIHEVLDVCHAVHHISLALAAYGLSESERMPSYREYRTLLRNGQWRRVVDELSELAADNPKNEQIHTEIAYLQKHGEAGRLSYTRFRNLGLPLGSGAIESSIRRVINLRLKGNGIFWRESQAESMLQIRAQVISNRWDQRLRQARELKQRDGRQDWTWTPRPMGPKLEDANPTLK